MAASLKLLPGSTVRWRGRRYLIVDYESLDAIIARQPGGFFSPLGICAKQTSIWGSLGTLVL
jgi:hypothetical protein